VPGEPAFDVLGIGTVAVDDVLTVARYPGPDEKAEILASARHGGGQVATALAAAAGLGARCAFAGNLGTDELSAFARRGLRQAGVGCERLVETPGAGPIHSVIVADAAGSRTIFYSRRAFRPLPASAVGEDLVGQARVLLIDQSGVACASAAADAARRLGVPVVADMEWPDQPGIDELMRRVDHLILPRQFAAAFTGLADPARMVGVVRARFRPACTVVTCGAEGCCFAIGGGAVRRFAAPAVRAVETTGCGDVFHGAYAAELARGLDVPACIATATAAAAAYAARPNGWANLPAREDLVGLME